MVDGVSEESRNFNSNYHRGLPYQFSPEWQFLFLSRVILASSHSFEYVGSGTDITTALPQNGGVTIPENEVDSKNGGLVIYTSTDHLVTSRLVMVL